MARGVGHAADVDQGAQDAGVLEGLAAVFAGVDGSSFARGDEGGVEFYGFGQG